MVEGEGSQVFGLSGHVILCGFGEVGRRVARVMDRHNMEYVVVDPWFRRGEEKTPKFFIGKDPTKEEVLIEAGIENAKTLVTTFDSDATNAFVILTAKTLSTNIRIVTTANSLENIEKLYRVGAAKVVSPHVVAGRMIARTVIAPFVAEFVNHIVLVEGVEIAQFEAPKGWKHHGKTLKDLGVRRVSNAMVVAILKKGELISNPSADTVVESGDTLVLLGRTDQLSKAVEHLKGGGG